MSAPSPPIVNFTPDARDGQIQFYWSPPLTGAPITNYTISSISPSVSVSTGPTDNCTCTIFGLTNGTEYTFTITADNVNGTSDPTTFRTVIPGAPPSPPQNQSYTFLNTERVNITWNSPSSDGGAPIYRYGVWVFPIDASSNPVSNLVSKVYTFGNEYNATVQLPYGVSSNYKYTVRAINDADWSVNNPALYSNIIYAPIPAVQYNIANWSGSGTLANTGSNSSIGAATLNGVTLTSDVYTNYGYFPNGSTASYLTSQSISSIYVTEFWIRTANWGGSGRYYYDMRNSGVDSYLINSSTSYQTQGTITPTNMYLDGVSVGWDGNIAGRTVGSTWRHVVLIWANRTFAPWFFNRSSGLGEGTVADCPYFAIHTTSLSATDVKNLFNSRATTFGRTPIP
jgi:hypothetical protein